MWNHHRRSFHPTSISIVESLRVYEKDQATFLNTFNFSTQQLIDPLPGPTSTKAFQAVDHLYTAIRFLNRYFSKTHGLDVYVILSTTTTPHLLGQALRYPNTSTAALFLFLNNVNGDAMFETLVHELLHGMGFGTTDLWRSYVDTENAQFLGPIAKTVANQSNIPLLALDNDAHSSDAVFNHWDKTGVFRGEVMNAWATDFFLHPITVAAVQDADSTWTASLCNELKTPCSNNGHCVTSHVGPSYCSAHATKPYPSGTFKELHAFAALVGVSAYIFLLLQKTKNANPSAFVFSQMEE